MKRGTIKKKCPKCGGNMFFHRDSDTVYNRESYSWYGWCLQCGYELYVRPGAARLTATEEVKV